MERLTIDEIIQHCENKTFLYETVGRNIDFETTELTDAIKEYWEHKQVKEYLEELKRYRYLEEQGLLLRLPCKVGTSVYMVAQDCGGDTLDCMRGDCEGCPYLYSFVEENKFETYMCDDIGKTVFLTKAEAEQKLKEMESESE